MVIAISSAIYRKGLSSLFSDKTFAVCEAETGSELERKLRTEQVDFVIVGQSLVSDMSLLPEGKFALMTRAPDKTYFLEALVHRACGYFLYSVSADLIRKAINALPGQCYLDPTLTSWLAELLTCSEKSYSNDKLLTLREREVLALKELHLSTREIASRLHISETTVKKHVHHILQKLSSGKNNLWKS